MAMNLLQVQKWLKTLPPGARTDQLLMAYANGANRDEVPPDMALGEMLRRKQMQQKAQMPTDTVKDQVERDFMQQQMNTMQAQAARGAAGQQQMVKQAASAPAPVAPGTPKPEPYGEEEVTAAKGGIMGLPAQFNFAPGGIVAFAEGDKVNEPTEAEIEAAKKPYFGGASTGYRRPENRQSDVSLIDKILAAFIPKEYPIETQRREAKEAEERKTKQEAEQAAQAASAAATESRPTPSPAPRPMAAEGGGPRQPVGEDAMAMALRYLKQSEETPLPKSYEQRLEEERAKPGSALAKPVLSGYEEFLNTLTQSDKERAAAAMEREKRRQQAEFFTALSAGAEASRGQRGVGALLGSVGKQLGGVQMAALERADKLAEIERDQAMKMAELRAKIEEARRAEARGDVKAKADADFEIARLQREIQANRLTAAGTLAQVQEMSRARAATAAQSQRDSLTNIAAMLRQADPKLGFKESLEAASRIKSGAAYERAGVANMEAYRKAVQDVDKKYPLLKVGKDTPQYRAELAKRNAEVAELQRMYGIGPGEGAGAPAIDTSQVKSVTQIK